MGVEEKQKVTDEIMKYRDLVTEKIITEGEFSIKEKELLFVFKKNA